MTVEMFYVAFYSDGAIESLIGSVEGHNGQELNHLEIDIWLSAKEKQGFRIEYLSVAEVTYRREAHGTLKADSVSG